MGGKNCLMSCRLYWVKCIYCTNANQWRYKNSISQKSDHSNKEIITGVRPTLFTWGGCCHANHFSVEHFHNPWPILGRTSNWQLSKTPGVISREWGWYIYGYKAFRCPHLLPDSHFILLVEGTPTDTVSRQWSLLSIRQVGFMAVILEVSICLDTDLPGVIHWDQTNKGFLRILWSLPHI